MKLTPSQHYPGRTKLIRLAWMVIISLPVIFYVFKISVLQHNGVFRGEDWDYFAQTYEAGRISIVHYHQFPWWNPWINGGQPLFGNPQFGLFSLQMPLVLLFGTVSGLHFSLLAYFLLGFWGMYSLLKRVGATSNIIVTMLSYIWVFSSFNAWHLAGGHFTFAVYLLAPWVFLTLINIHRKRGWLWFGLAATIIIQSAVHYLTVETLAICVVIVAIQVARRIYHNNDRTLRTVAPILMPYILATVLVLVLCGAKLFYTYQFTHEYPRPEPLDPPESLKMFIAALTFRHPVDPSVLTYQGIMKYGWVEYADYCGFITLSLFSYMIIRRFESIRSLTLKDWLILAGTVLAGLISLGNFGSFSPFNILHGLPIFNQMRVPSRFLCWAVLGIILFLAKLPKKPIIYILLIFSTLDVFQAGYAILNYPQKQYVQTQHLSNKFEQQEFYKTNPALGQEKIFIEIQDFRLLRATQSNIGEVYGYEPILNVAEFYYYPAPSRCGIKQGCDFVRTKNASVVSWSPHRIVLKRSAGGPIELNMNPGKVWYANGKQLFPNYKILDLQKKFIIPDISKDIVVHFKPVL